MVVLSLLHKTINWLGGVLPAIVPSIQVGMVVRTTFCKLECVSTLVTRAVFSLVDSDIILLRLEWLLNHFGSFEF